MSLLECLAVLGRTRVVAAADTDGDSRARTRPHLPQGCRTHEDARKVIEDPEVELVYISTPDHTHADLAIAAMAAGKGVLCEKPMATTVEDCDRIIDAIGKTGRESVLVGIAAERSAAEGRIVELEELRRSSAHPKASLFGR